MVLGSIHNYRPMMKKLISYAVCALLAATPLASQAQTPSGSGKVTGQRRYDIIVNQSNDTLTFNRGLRSLKGNSARLSNRGILTDLATGYLSLGTSTLLSASQNILGVGLGMAKEALRDKRPDWEKATMGENRFVKHLPMLTEVLDFYASPSTIGALDPTDMKFSGFGCNQYIALTEPDGKTLDEEVFYLSCSLRDDEHGMARMLNHSKFEVVVDELRFNPWLCNLPNDSLSVDPSTRIGFSFDKRSNLEFKVVATIKSSWINEAIQIARDVELGKFTITARIDPDALDADGIFVYSRKENPENARYISVSGDAFIVPRSFVGSEDMANPSPSWGTGQYRVEMDITESCDINPAYYTTMEGGKRRWVKSRWQPEWKMMRQRPRRGGGASLVDMIFPQFSGDAWITTIAEPTVTVLLKEEGRVVNAASEKFATKAGLTPGSPGGAAAPNAAAAQKSGQTGSQKSGQTGGQPQKPTQP